MRIFFKNVDSTTSIFTWDNQQFTIADLVRHYNLNSELVYFTVQGRPLQSSSVLAEFESLTIESRLRLRGGKGGFGSLLKGQPAVKKRTKNFDACRDISGRRIRHVNQEKQLIEWQQKKEEEERIISQSNKGNAEEIKRQLQEDKRNEIVRENNKFFEEDNHTKHSVEKSLRFLTQKRKREGKAGKTTPKQPEETERTKGKIKGFDMKELEIKDDVSKEDLLKEILAL